MGPGALRRRGLPSVRLILGIATQQDARSSQPHLAVNVCDEASLLVPIVLRDETRTRVDRVERLELILAPSDDARYDRGTLPNNEVLEWIVAVFATAEVIRLRRI